MVSDVLGEVVVLIVCGVDAFGYRYGSLLRNAPGCDAQGVCCFGCPTDAKRSTNVSYVPLALQHGAMLYHHARVTRVLRGAAAPWASRPSPSTGRLRSRAG